MWGSTFSRSQTSLIIVIGLLFCWNLSFSEVASGEEAGVDAPVTIRVFKTPTCGCCVKWVDHLKAAGFNVETTNLPDLTTLKQMNGVPPNLAACHTALVGSYVVEGHVPAADIQRLLAEKPKVGGLAVAGMPLGSPGMEHPDPRRHEAYEVVAFGADSPSGQEVFATHRP